PSVSRTSRRWLLADSAQPVPEWPQVSGMASLQILKGNGEGTVIPLNGEKYILGRNPDCDIVVPVTSVSRDHAQILRAQGRYYIEDKQPRNGTFVNNAAITSRKELKNNDKIRICDFLAAFLDDSPRSARRDLVAALTAGSEDAEQRQVEVLSGL